MADSEVFVEPVEQIKPVKKKKVMSEGRKEQLRKQLADAREKKKLLKAGGKKPVKKEEPVKKVKFEVKEVVHAPTPTPTPTPIPSEPQVPVAPSESAAELIRLKKELAELKANKQSKSDMEEIRALKAEMVEIRDAAKAYKQSQAKAKKDLEKRMKETPVAAPAPLKVVVEPIVAPTKARYSTYKKSIWTKFT